MKDVYSMNTKKPSKLALCLLSTLTFAGCSSDDSDSADGYVLFYNASDNAPELTVSMESDDTFEYTGIDASETSGLLTMSSETYTMEISLSTDVSSDTTLFNQSQSVTGEDVSLVVVAGDIKSPELLTYSYEFEDPDSEDDEFTLRFISLDNNGDIDIYMALEENNFADSTLVDSLSYSNLSQSHYFDVEEYKFYLTKSGSKDVIFESDPIAFYYTNQQIIVVKQEGNEENEQYVIEKLSSTGSVSRYQHVANQARFKIYNAMDKNALLPDYSESFDFYLGQVGETATIDNLVRYQMSDNITVQPGDFTMDITTDEQQVLTDTHVLSLSANDDKTVFYYHTEVEEEDDEDDSTTEETELFVNTLFVDNNTTTDVYQHEIKLINFVEDHASLTVYFVEAGDTLATTPYKTHNSRAVPSSLQLYNGNYHVYVMAQEGASEILLADLELNIDEDFGHQFLLIEQEDKDIDNYHVQFIPQQ